MAKTALASGSHQRAGGGQLVDAGGKAFGHGVGMEGVVEPVAVVEIALELGGDEAVLETGGRCAS